jgi:hypothetical protein
MGDKVPVRVGCQSWLKEVDEIMRRFDPYVPEVVGNAILDLRAVLDNRGKTSRDF